MTRDGEIEITVSALHGRTYIYIYKLRAGCTTRWARSRSPKYIYISAGPCLHIPDIVLNVFKRFYFSVYGTISLEPCASRLCRCFCHGQLLSAVPCNTACLDHCQLRQYQFYNLPSVVLEWSQLLLCFVSTCDNNLAMRFLQKTMYTQLAAVPFYIVVCIPVGVGSLNMRYCVSLWTIIFCVHRIYRACGSLTTTSGVAPASLSIAL